MWTFRRLNERIIVCLITRDGSGGTVSHHVDDHGQVVRHLGYPTRQCLERWLAADPWYAGHMASPIISTGDEDKGRSNWCWAACAEANRRTARRGCLSFKVVFRITRGCEGILGVRRRNSPLLIIMGELRAQGLPIAIVEEIAFENG